VLLRIEAFDKVPEHRHVCATSHWRDPLSHSAFLRSGIAMVGAPAYAGQPA